MGRLKIKRGAGKQWVEGKTFRLAEEVRYFQRRAAWYDARIVTLGQLLLFSTETGDAWLLDPSDQLATPLARDGDVFPVHIKETDTNFVIGWIGVYRIDGAAFIYRDKDSGNIRTILGYPTQRITHEISNMFG
jgi:mevalonate kinase